MALVNLTTQYTSLKFGNDQKGGGSSGLPYATFDIALVNLKTQYTSLKFGNDQKGGGDSGLPYIKFDTNGNANTPDGTISVANSTLSDFPKRGGTYPSNNIDFQRIKAFLNSAKGTIFNDKQQTLQFMNPKTETGVSMRSSDNTKTLPGLISNTRVYSIDNLLNQIKVEGTGAHIARVGSDNFGIQDDFYATTVGIQNITNSAVTNRLAILRNLKISNISSNMFSSFDQFLSSAENILLAKSLGISANSTLLFNYPGGPNSSYGVGDTIVRRAVDTTLNTLPNVMNYAQIAKKNAIQGAPVITNSIKDFRQGTQGYKYAQLTWYPNINMENRIGISNPGIIDPTLPQGKPTSYIISVSSDKINSGMPTVFKNDIDPWQALGYTDSIKLGFECLSNDDSKYSTALIFRALLSNGFTDNNSAVLNSFRYMGRGEEFHTYQGFTRAISFSFKIAAFSRSELKPLYNKLNYLISQVYPDYSPNTNIMRAPVVKITLGDYLYRVPGFLESVNVTVDNNTPWEINLESSTDVQELPHVLEVAISFKPIFSNLPQRFTDEFTAKPIIGNPNNSFIDINNTVIKSNGKVSTGNNLNPQSIFSTPTPTAPPIQPNNFGTGPGSTQYNGPDYYETNSVSNNTIVA